MTCREKLRRERPDAIVSVAPGGCKGCPQHYGYLPPPGICIAAHGGNANPQICTRCWDREIPESEE